jgi:hypothetical protein
VISFISPPLYAQGKGSLNLTDRRLGGLQAVAKGKTVVGTRSANPAV